MPLDINFGLAPYFDDFTVANQYYAILFKPSVSVQARELNQMQSILRNQIEKFGDQIFQVGTVIDGCNFNFFPSYPYVKIKDIDVTGLNVTLASYLGLFVKNSANLQAIIVNTITGFETTAPDLNTLYVSYRNSGANGSTYQFSPGDVLTVFDSNTGIWAVTVNNAGVGFANSDTPVFTSALAVNVTSGSFSNGDYVTQPSTGANLQIINIDATSLSSVGQILLTLKPRTVDLANSSANGSQWQVANNDTIRNSGNTAVGSVINLYGSGAAAVPVTDGSGRITSIVMTSRGAGYSFLPTVTINSPNNTTGVTALSLVPQNYLTQVTISNTASAVGNGYAFGVSNGTIYQKGLFLTVDAQTIVIDKYDQTPNAVSVGFLSAEQIVTSNIDTNLLDNAAGFYNYQAPGADRIKVVPTLSVQAANNSDPGFLPLVIWSEGNPYRQNQATAYSAIGDAMATELYDTEGDFILSRFDVTSRSPYTSAKEGTTISLITNPGSAYIKGRKVINETNYSTDILKTTDTTITSNTYITLNYGNWIRINQVGGVFQFSTADTVTFYDAAQSFISGGNVRTGNTTPTGNIIGTARIRSMVHELGLPGDANCTYKLYLFDIVMNQGSNFSSIRSVYYNNTYTGIADVVLTRSPTTNLLYCALANNAYDYLLFGSGADSLKNANQVSYTYRTIDQTTTFSNTGILTKNISTSPSETFPYAGALTSNQLLDLYVVPVANSLIASANAAGSANTLTSSANITGNSTTWVNDFAAGDFIYIFANSITHDVRRVVSVANNTLMTLDANVAFSLNNNGVYRYFPQNAPIPLGIRTGLTANVSANQQLLTVSLGMNLQGSVTVNTAIATNILRTNIATQTKTPARDQFIQICTSNNAGGVAGPWCVGIADIFRLKRVFLGNTSTVNTNSTEVTSYFYIDHKQNEDYVDIGYLNLMPASGLTIANGQFMLVQFDAFQSSGAGYFCTPSYLGANAAAIAVNDATQLVNLGTSLSSWEIPEVFGSRGQYFDLMNQFDFRPVAANSTTASANASLAPLNPTYSLSFGNTANPANDKKFPLPDSVMSYTMEQYLSRTDGLFCDTSGNMTAVRGFPAVTPKPPNGPKSSILLASIYLPPYPCLPAHMGNMQQEILTTRIANIKYLARRQSLRTIKIPSAPGTPYDTQPRRYTMSDIGTLDRRIGALEYYTSLSALQTDMVNTVVPSSVDNSINRFQFGIFVDDFSTTVSQDVTNPSYAAAITASNMTPPTVSWAIGYGKDIAVAQPYLDFQIISQPDASFPIPPPPPPAPPPSPPVVPPPPPVVVSANVWLLRTDHLAPSNSGQIALTDTISVTMANTAGPVTFYFYIPTTTTLYVTTPVCDPVSFNIYQGNTLIANGYANSVSLTAADVTYLNSGTAGQGQFFLSVPISAASLSRPANNYLNGSGKMSFNHNPSNGLTYTIVSTRQSLYDHWLYGMQYPSSFGASIVVSPSATPATYAGHMDIQPATLLLQLYPKAAQIWVSNPSSGASALLGTTVKTGNGKTVGSTFNTTTGLTVANPGTDYTSIGVNLSVANKDADPLGDESIPTTTYTPQNFAITCYGLMPSTTHKFTVNGIDKTADTLIPGKAKGGPLTTDQYGILRFDYFFNGSTTDQDIVNQYIGTQSKNVTWGTEAAASLTQPIQEGNLTCVISAPSSTASFSLALVADADLVLNTVQAAIAAGAT